MHVGHLTAETNNGGELLMEPNFRVLFTIWGVKSKQPQILDV